MEFQPVVMAAGRGSRIADLTSSMPKALLPVGNMPMVWYPINMLERAGFKEAIVIVLDSFKDEINKQLTQTYNVSIKLEFVSIPDSHDFIGTADSLRRIKDKIKRDILLVSCDLIMDVSLHHIVNLYRMYDATVTMLLCNTAEPPTDMPLPGPKSKKRSEKDFIGFDVRGPRMVFMTSEADLDSDDTVQFRRSMLKKHPNINIRSNLTDCHLYLIKKCVVDYLAEAKTISSVKGELIPHLVKKQFSRRKPVSDSGPDIFKHLPENKQDKQVREMTTWIDHTGDMDDCFHGEEIRCYAYVVEDKFCVRTNTLSTYWETNRQIQKFFSSISREVKPLSPSSTFKDKTQVGNDCLVDEGVSIGERVSVKKSIIGKHCSIGDNVKITNSVVFDHVQIGKGCVIQGSIVSSEAQINEKCDLKDCIVGKGQRLQDNSKFTNEAIVDDNRMMSI